VYCGSVLQKRVQYTLLRSKKHCVLKVSRLSSNMSGLYLKAHKRSIASIENEKCNLLVLPIACPEQSRMEVIWVDIFSSCEAEALDLELL